MEAWFCLWSIPRQTNHQQLNPESLGFRDTLCYSIQTGAEELKATSCLRDLDSLPSSATCLNKIESVFSEILSLTIHREQELDSARALAAKSLLLMAGRSLHPSVYPTGRKTRISLGEQRSKEKTASGFRPEKPTSPLGCSQFSSLVDKSVHNA